MRVPISNRKPFPLIYSRLQLNKSSMEPKHTSEPGIGSCYTKDSALVHFGAHRQKQLNVKDGVENCSPEGGFHFVAMEDDTMMAPHPKLRGVVLALQVL